MKDIVDRKSTSVLAVIITYNGQQWIEKCFRSLSESTLSVDIVVIDNGSTDGTPSIIRAKFPQVNVIEAGENLGFGKANNIGLKKCIDENYQYAFLLNQDAWVEPTTIENLIYHQKNNEKIGIAVPLQLNANGDKLDGLFFSFCLSGNESFMNAAVNSKIQSNETYELDFANAACWLIPIRILKTIGGFDPIFPHYGEDEDFIARIKSKGYIVALCPNEIVYHDREFRSKGFELNREVNATFVQTLNVLKSRESNSLKSSYFLLRMLYVQLIKFIFFYNKKYYLSTILGIVKASAKAGIAAKHVKQEQELLPHYLN